MANIQFVPVCSKCGGTIFGQIGYEKIPEHLAPSECIYKQYQIYPRYCKACGEPFEQIIMQKIIAINHNSGLDNFSKSLGGEAG